MEREAGSAERIEQAIRALADQPPERAVIDLTAVANRAIIELHKAARQQAGARRGAADWGAWARLANAARSCVLQVAAVRDSLKTLRTDAAQAAGADESIESSDESEAAAREE